MVVNSATIPFPAYALRPMQPADLAQVLQIEQASYRYPWSRKIFEDCLANAYYCWVLEQDTEIQAYTIWSLALDEAHVLNLCVSVVKRRQGLGRDLLQKLCAYAYKKGARSLFLELRPSNQAAFRVYQNAGFCEVGLRKAYYPASNGREDALIMAKSLQAEW